MGGVEADRGDDADDEQCDDDEQIREVGTKLRSTARAMSIIAVASLGVRIAALFVFVGYVLYVSIGARNPISLWLVLLPVLLGSALVAFSTAYSLMAGAFYARKSAYLFDQAVFYSALDSGAQLVASIMLLVFVLYSESNSSGFEDTAVGEFSFGLLPWYAVGTALAVMGTLKASEGRYLVDDLFTLAC